MCLHPMVPAAQQTKVCRIGFATTFPTVGMINI
jgi:hypothetical protein